MRIIKEDCLVLAIDFQEKLVPAMSNIDKVLDKSIKLLEGMNVLDVPVICSTQYKKGLGETVGNFKHIVNSGEFDKLFFSCYDDENIKKTVDSHDKKNIIILGIEAHVCVLQTVLDLCAAGYNCILVADCITSRKDVDCMFAIDRARDEGAIITTYESLLFELQRVAGNDKFKEVSRIVK